MTKQGSSERNHLAALINELNVQDSLSKGLTIAKLAIQNGVIRDRQNYADKASVMVPAWTVS